MPSLDEMVITVGARSSPLSRVQVQEVLAEIQSHYPSIQFSTEYVSTTGDIDLGTSLKAMDKTDFFTKEIDQMLLNGICRISIHSAKDLPEPLAQGLVCVALTKGVDPSDVLVLRDGETLASLAPFAKVATSSHRREEMIKELRNDLQSVDIRGTIGDRLNKLDRGDVDALVMAEAALIRLGLTSRSRIPLPGPAAAYQGQLAVLARVDDHEMAKVFAAIDVRVQEALNV